jgi:hypothetical protein
LSKLGSAFLRPHFGASAHDRFCAGFRTPATTI